MSSENEVAVYWLHNEVLRVAREHRLLLRDRSCPTDPVEKNRLDRNAFFLDSIIALYRVADYLLAGGGNARPEELVRPPPPGITPDDPPDGRGLGVLSVPSVQARVVSRL
jgi:hypothetical protein